MIFGWDVGPTISPSFQSTSWIFSPASTPVKTIGDVFLLPAGKADHLLREIEDAHRLAHVEHVDLAAAAHRAGLDHE